MVTLASAVAWPVVERLARRGAATPPAVSNRRPARTPSGRHETDHPPDVPGRLCREAGGPAEERGRHLRCVETRPRFRPLRKDDMTVGHGRVPLRAVEQDYAGLDPCPATLMAASDPRNGGSGPFAARRPSPDAVLVHAPMGTVSLKRVLAPGLPSTRRT